MKWLIILSLMFTGINSFAQYDDASDDLFDNNFTEEEEQEQQIQGPQNGEDLLRRLLVKQPYQQQVRQNFSETVFEMILNNEVKEFEINQSLSPDFNRANDPRKKLNYCHKFIKPDGNYGDWGLGIINSIDSFPEIKSMLTDNSAADKAGMRNVCPRFNEMNYNERKDFWVWTLTALALFESTCGYDTTNASNSRAVGIFQLNSRISDRAPRSLAARGLCGRLTGTQVAQPSNNIFCTLDFMRDSFSGRMTHAPAGLITEAQQFERLRDPNNGIIRVIKKLKICHPRPLT